MTAINIALVLMAVLFIGGMVLIGRRSDKSNKPTEKSDRQRLF